MREALSTEENAIKQREREDAILPYRVVPGANPRLQPDANNGLSPRGEGGIEPWAREDAILPHKNSRPDDGHPSGLWEQTPHPRELVLDRNFKVWDYRLE